MKTFQRAFFTGFLFLMAGISFGQEADGDTDLTPEERATRRTEEMKQELSLTVDQTEKIYAINLEHILEMDKLREEQKALREKMRAQKESTRTKIKAVLTPEQNVIFDQKTEEYREKQAEKKGDHKD